MNNVVELLALRAPTVDDLPPPNIQRRVARRKPRWSPLYAAARSLWRKPYVPTQLAEEEFLSWQCAFEAHGLAGLRATRIQQYRGSRPPRDPRSRR